jgi:hypothetical protein
MTRVAVDSPQEKLRQLKGSLSKLIDNLDNVLREVRGSSEGTEADPTLVSLWIGEFLKQREILAAVQEVIAEY